VLLYGAAIVEEEGLRVPHPHLTERSFVLAPLCDLAPNARHPILNRSFADLLRSLGSSQAYEVVEGISLMPDSK
jgi:2-amino-4-hydroxy-6-hydroxymethyldihydropteridine diphosphokinase